jgi:hypothetical protein
MASMTPSRLLLAVLLVTPAACRSESKETAEAVKVAYRATIASQAAKFGPKVTRLAAALKQANSIDEVRGDLKCVFRPCRSAVPADADHPFRPRRSPGA